MPKYVGGQEYAQPKMRMSQRFSDSFSAALQGIADAMEAQRQTRQDEELIEKMSDPNLSEMERAKYALKLSPNGQKAVTTALDLYYKLQKQQERARYQQDELDLRREKEGRLKGQNEAEDLERMYKTELRDLQDQINETLSEKDKKSLRDRRTALQKERAANISRLKKGEEPVLDYLTYGKEQPVQATRQPIETMSQLGMGGGAPNQNIPGATVGINPNAENSNTSYTPNAPQNAARNATNLRQQAPQMQQGSVGMTSSTPTQPQRVRWDKNNPEHQAFAAKVYQDTGGDRARTNAILAEQFER